jgi:hypothetical protein
VDQIGKFILNTKGGKVPKLNGLSRIMTQTPWDNSQRLIEKTRSDAQKMLTKMINKCMAKTLTNNYKGMHPKAKNYKFPTSVKVFSLKMQLGSIETLESTQETLLSTIPKRKKFVTRHHQWTFLAPKKMRVLIDPFAGVKEEFPEHTINHELEGATLIVFLGQQKKEIRAKERKAREKKDALTRPKYPKANPKSGNK